MIEWTTMLHTGYRISSRCDCNVRYSWCTICGCIRVWVYQMEMYDVLLMNTIHLPPYRMLL